MIRRPRLAFTLSIALLALLLTGTARAGLWTAGSPDPKTGRMPLELVGEERLLPPGWKLRVPDTRGIFGTEAGAAAVSLDPASGQVRESYQEGEVELRAPLVAPIAQYDSVVTARTVRKLWREKTRQSRSVARTTRPTGGTFRVELPIQLPKTLRSIVGDGAPNLEVSGSETISLAGTSNWTVRKSGFDTERQRQSAFPSLEMKQDLAVNVTGSIGDKIKVDLDQSSNVTTSLDNKVKLRY